MSNAGPLSSVMTNPVDRVPQLGDLLRQNDLHRCLAPFVAGVVDGVMLFDVAGVPFGGYTDPSSPLRHWDQLPPEAHEALRRRGRSFGLSHHVFDLRPAYAGTDRVGVLVVSRHADPGDRGLPFDLADALAGVLAQLLQSGFATWVTSELHLAASESHHATLSQQNSELQRAIEHLRELDKLKSNFLATVSHELRTPLTSVIGFSEMLLEGLAGPVNPEQREYVQTILARGEELLQLITQILEMSRLEVGAVRIDPRPHELRELVARALHSVELQAQAADVRIEVDGGIGELPTLLVDAEKMQRVLVNLFGNAIKFSRPGSRIWVSGEPAPIRRPFEEETLFGEELADAVRITVRDEGIGIPPEQMARIFEAFYQVDAGPTRNHGGAGLGLSIVRSLIEAHGGEVWADSEVGVGTSFHVTVPIASEGAERV